MFCTSGNEIFRRGRSWKVEVVREISDDE